MKRNRSGTDGRRIVIIGLDGASFNHLDPILESGRLPGFARFFDSGVRSDCVSTIPPLTPPAWSTMLTGVNPGKHGIFDFLQPDETGAFRVVDAGFRRRRTFLDYAQASGIRTIGLLIPYTYPPDPKTTGLMVSGLGTPSSESDFIRPHEFRDVLLRDFPFLREVDPTRGESFETFHESLRARTASTVELARRGMQSVPDWGITFVVFQATDLVPHFYSRFFDENHPDYEMDDAYAPKDYRESLIRIYEAIDPFVSESLDAVEKDGGWVMLVSDHGSQPLVGAIGKDAFLARWLELSGYLTTTGQKGRMRQAAVLEIGSLANRLMYLVKRHTPHGLRDAVNRLLGERKEGISKKITAIPFMEGIVWEETSAFCAPGGYGVGLYINREGDFPHGNVARGGEYHRLRDEIKAGLESLELGDGVPMFRSVLSRDEALWGPAVSEAPDLLLMWREDVRLKANDYLPADGTSLDAPEVKPGSRLTWCGTHRMEGLFGLAGEGVKAGLRLGEIPNLADVYPTIHMLAGLEVPSDIDGRVISEAFESGFLEAHKPREGPPEDSSGERGESAPPDESDKMIELLKGLGYLH